jgi:predicted enzyme related to lactoylglutathione lyase
MTSVERYNHGQFSWIDLMTPDIRASRNFYSELFDWDTFDNPPTNQGAVYVEFQFDGRPVAGMGEMASHLRNSGLPAVWSSYINVDDVDATADEAEFLGATLEMPPMQIMDAGRMAVVIDPVGARVSLWQPGQHQGAGIVNSPTSLCWNELVTPNPEDSIRFYGDLFDWEFRRTDEEESVYYEVLNQGRANGGVIEMTEEWGSLPPHWMPYISVFDCDATLEKATKLGGSVDMDPVDIAPGRFSVVVDPQGAAITVMQLSEED